MLLTEQADVIIKIQSVTPITTAQAGVGILTSPRLSDFVSDWNPSGSRVCMLKLKILGRSLCLLHVYVPNSTSKY